MGGKCGIISMKAMSSAKWGKEIFSLCSHIGKNLFVSFYRANARELANRALELQMTTEIRHQVAAFMERRGMGGLIRGGR